MPVEIGYFTLCVPDVYLGCLCHDNQGVPFHLWQPAPGY